MQLDLIALARTSLQDPRAAATEIMGLQLTRDVLWTALALVAILNTAIVLLVVQVSGPSMPLPGYIGSPITIFVLIAGLMVVYVHAMYWAALAIGGSGSLNDVLAVLIWFQVLRAAAQIAVLVLSLAIPVLGLMLSLVVAIWGLWIFLNFLAAAMLLKSAGHALVVLVISAVGLILGLGILMSLIGIAA